MKNLAIIITHPIQYYSPLFKLLSERNTIQIKVFYTWEQSKDKVFDTKFNREIKWDIPLLEAYEYQFVKNISKNPGSGTFNGVVNPTLISEIENWKADAVLVFGWNHNSHFKAMRYFKGKIPVYFRGDSTLIDETEGIKTLIRRLSLKFIYRYIDIAFYVGTNNKNYFLKHGLSETQLIFAPHAIDNDRFYDIYGEYQTVANDWRLKLGYSENDKVLLFVGKFEKKKNPFILIETAKLLPEYKFLFVGNGELEEKMKQTASKNVSFLPFQNQSFMPAIYRIGDIFVLPSSYNETWGLAVNEALVCKKPVIVSDKVGCAVDLVEEGENGYIFESGNIGDLVSKIKLICKIKSFSRVTGNILNIYNFTKISEEIEKTIIKS